MKPAGTSKTREITAALAVLIIVVVIVAVAAMTNPKKTATAKTAAPAKVQLSTTKAAAGSLYQNGTFSGTGSYDSPGGPEKFNLTVTLTNDVITNTSATSGSGDITSREYQEQFIGGYKQLVVGKKISDVKLGAVSGSSLTAQGFNQALVQIEQEAKQG